jgi:hypothetical protein
MASHQFQDLKGTWRMDRLESFVMQEAFLSLLLLEDSVTAMR